MKRKRIKSKGTLVASSNGVQTLLPMSRIRELENDFWSKMGSYNYRVQEGYEWEVDDPALMRGESMLMEEYSDKLWDLGLHTRSLMWLMDAACRLIDWDQVEIGYDTNYHHRNLSRFRYLFGRCWERVRQDPSLEPLFLNSTVYDWFMEMDTFYGGNKGIGLVP